MYQVAIEKKINPIWNFVFEKNIDLREKANEYLDYSMMKRYKNQTICDRMAKDSEDFRNRADVYDMQKLQKWTKGE